MNLTNQQVGHIKREFSQKLSPLIDARLILVEGTIRGGNMRESVYNLTMYDLVQQFADHSKPEH